MLYGASKLPSAASGSNTPTYPETTTIANNDFTVPFAPGNQYREVTVTVKPLGAGGSAVIQSRPASADAWFDLTELDLTDGATRSERLNAPFGQLRVKNNGNASGIVVSVEGLPNY